MAEQGVSKQEQTFEEIELTVNKIQDGKVQQESKVESNTEFEVKSWYLRIALLRKHMYKYVFR